MMNTRCWDPTSLINELNQARELVDQLSFLLTTTSPHGEVLIGKLRYSFDKAISMVNSNGADAEAEAEAESPKVVSSDESEDKDVHRKRRMLPRWREQCQVGMDRLYEPVEDGYNWRKYGQKIIHGTIYPRSYYRCTYREARGCLARKHVQRSDHNSSMFDVIYGGNHTCAQASHLTVKLQSAQKKDRKQHQDQQETRRGKQSHDMILLNFQTGPKIKTADLDCLHFSSTLPFSTNSAKSESNISLSSFCLENNSISPTTSEANHFIPCDMNCFESRPCFTSLEPAASFTFDSPTIDLDFELEPIEIDPDVFFELGLDHGNEGCTAGKE